MSEPIRILQVMSIMNRGGAETMVMNLYRQIDRARVQFDFIVHSDIHGDYDDEIKNLGGIIFFCPRYSGKNHIQYVNWWKQFFVDHPEYRVLHFHIRSIASVVIPTAKKHGLICIVHSHSTSNGQGVLAFVKDLYQFPLRFQADWFIGCSIESGKWLFGDRIVSGDRYLTLPNAVDIETFRFDPCARAEIRNQLSIPDECLVYITVGRMSRPKNVDGIISICQSIMKSLPKRTKFIWVGTGEERNHIEESIKEKGLQNEIILTGIRSDVNRYLSAADVFIMPSLWEGLPVAAVEAQASGLPCLLSDRITQEVNISPLVEYLPIDQGYQIWTDRILNVKKERRDVSDDIRRAGFDIRTSAELLQSFYLSL